MKKNSAACGAEYGPQHALLEDEEKLKENLEAYNKAEAEKAEAARIAAEKKAAEEKAAAEAAARKAAEEKAAAEEAARKKRLHRKIFLVYFLFRSPSSSPRSSWCSSSTSSRRTTITMPPPCSKPASMTKPSPRSTALDGYSDSARPYHGGRVIKKDLRPARKREIRRSHRSLHRPRRLRRQQRSDHRGRVPPCRKDV